MAKTKKSKHQSSILIVGEDAAQLDSYLAIARGAGFNTFGALSPKVALEALRKSRFEFLLTDLHPGLPRSAKGSAVGLQIVAAALEQQPGIVPLVMSDAPTREIYEQTKAAGVCHHYRKPVSADEFLFHLEGARHLRAVEAMAADAIMAAKLARVEAKESAKAASRVSAGPKVSSPKPNLPRAKKNRSPGAFYEPSKPGSPAPSQALTDFISKAMHQDVPLAAVVEALEREILAKAFERHPSLREASNALQIARTTLAGKRDRYFPRRGRRSKGD